MLIPYSAEALSNFPHFSYILPLLKLLDNIFICHWPAADMPPIFPFETNSKGSCVVI